MRFLEANAAAVQIGGIEECSGHRIFIAVADKRGRAGAGIGIVIPTEIGRPPMAGQNVERERRDLAPGIEGLLV